MFQMSFDLKPGIKNTEQGDAPVTTYTDQQPKPHRKHTFDSDNKYQNYKNICQKK